MEIFMAGFRVKNVYWDGEIVQPDVSLYHNGIAS